MRTEDLVEQLAAKAAPVGADGRGRWLSAALVAGGVVSLTVLVAWLGLRPLEAAAVQPAFWMKAFYSLALALSGGLIVWRLAKPTGRVGRAPYLLAAALMAVGVMAMMQLMRAPEGAMPALVLGHTWKWCPFRILTLSLPLTLALGLAMRRLAPTRLALAGGAAGVLAGGLAAAIYGLYCQETSAVFLAIWYTLGIAASGALGALIGPRLMRW
jgi:hypothetical protein